jgi:hypothetical protein
LAPTPHDLPLVDAEDGPPSLSGHTLLMWYASPHMRVERARHLLQRGANVDQRDAMGRTVLHWLVDTKFDDLEDEKLAVLFFNMLREFNERASSMWMHGMPMGRPRFPSHSRIPFANL